MPWDVDASDARRAVGAAVGLAALVLLVNILLAHLVTRRSRDIRDGLERLRETTAELRRTPEWNRTIEQMTRALQAMREGEAG